MVIANVARLGIQLKICYFLMELIRSYTLEVEVNDKCYVNFVSVNMEKNALRSALQ